MILVFAFKVVHAICDLQPSNGLAQVAWRQRCDRPPAFASAAPVSISHFANASCMLALICWQDAANLSNSELTPL